MNHYQRIKDIREDNDLSKEQIAKLLQRTRQKISKYEIK